MKYLDIITLVFCKDGVAMVANVVCCQCMNTKMMGSYIMVFSEVL